jgi:hypothetical protein
MSCDFHVDCWLFTRDLEYSTPVFHKCHTDVETKILALCIHVPSQICSSHSHGCVEYSLLVCDAVEFH